MLLLKSQAIIAALSIALMITLARLFTYDPKVCISHSPAFHVSKETYLHAEVLRPEISISEAEHRYNQLITTNTGFCPKSVRLGKAEDGGWDVCESPDVLVQPPCTVYSFGINHVWEFDDTLSKNYMCQVHAFDPSMNVKTHKRNSNLWFNNEGIAGSDRTMKPHNWKVSKLSTILKRASHEELVIDILKFDVEFSEWEMLETAIKENALRNVRQMMFETHTKEIGLMKQNSEKDDFLKWIQILKDLHKLGFRMWHSSWNPYGNYTSKHTYIKRTCCHEQYYVNINLLKKH